MSIETNNKLKGKINSYSSIKDSGISVKGETGNGIEKIEKTNSVGLKDIYTIYFTDGNISTFEVTNGERGIDGTDGKSLQFNWDGTNLGIKTEGSSEYTYVDLKGKQGEKGETGDVSLEQLNNTKTELENKAIVKKTKIKGKTLQEGEPSPDNPVDIRNVGDNVNLLNCSSFETKTINGVTITNNNGRFKLNGTSTATISIQLSNTMNNLKKGNYYLSRNSEGSISGGTFTNILYVKETSDSAAVSKANLTSGGQSVNIDKKYEEYYLWLYIPANITFTNYILKPKLEEGSTATKYSPYNYGTIDLKLQKDEDIQEVTFISKRLHEDDYINENGTHYNAKSYALTGTEGWNIASEGFFCNFNFLNIKLKSKLKCNQYKNCSTFAELQQREYGIGMIYSSSYNVYIKNKDITTLDDFKVYLTEQYANGTPVIVEYKLAEEEIEKFDETNQTAFNKLESLLLEGYTLIDSSSDELQPEIELTEYTANEIHRENVEKFKEIDDNSEKITNLEENMILNFAKKLNFMIGDNTTKEIEINLNKVYLFINSHTYQRCMLFITTFKNSLKIDTIFKSADSAVPEITMEDNKLIITTKNQARGYLFKIQDINCG